MRVEILLAAIVLGMLGGEVATPAAGYAQQAPVLLGPPSVIAREVPFSGRAHSELPDGRLLTYGVAELVTIDPRTGIIDTIGRQGQGPGEYQGFLSAARALDDGRIAALDRHSLRVTIWRADRTLDTTISVPHFALHFTSELDAQGRVYWGDIPADGRQYLGPGDRPGRHPDSTWLYRLAPPQASFDTIGAIIHRPSATIGSQYRIPVRFGGQDFWGILQDGTLWVARVRENRVDRRPPGRGWQIGTPRAWRPVRTTRADRRMIPDLSTPDPRDSVTHPMAPAKPPFDYAVAADDGEVWTHKSAS